MGKSLECGSLWNRWDLHFHTPSSFDYHDKTITNEQIVNGLVHAGVRVVAINDHHTMDITRIRNLQTLGIGKLTVFPGIELRDDHGGDPIHYICIFPEDCKLDHVWTTFQGSLGLTSTAIEQKGGDEKVYVPIEKGATQARELGGVISIHAGAKSNSIESISNYQQFQHRIKYDITKEYVDFMEIGQLKDVESHLKIIFPATGLDKALVLCSDNHRVTEYVTKAPLWFRADPTFRGLLMVLREPRDRIFIGDRPAEIIRVEQNRTKYIRGISFQRKVDAPASEHWFSGFVKFNHGLVAIVGNKGSGKSALADTIGLLGASKNADSFSFLNKDRFCHPSSRLAGFFTATLEWESGETATKCLADTIRPEEVERLKYLPQDHIETVCNKIKEIGEEGFEQELKAVIFSHVQEAQRLGHTTLDELVRFQTEEKQKRIGSLLKQLREVSRSRAILEAEADPATKLELAEKISRRKLELEAHDKIKPPEITNPATNAVIPGTDATLLQELLAAKEAKKTFSDQITITNETLRKAERRQAVAKRLLDKLDNFQKDFSVFKTSLDEDAAELGLKADELVTMTINKTKPVMVRDEAAVAISAAKQQLEGINPPGLRQKLAAAEENIVELQSKLDAPNRAYQAYLKALEEWQIKRSLIVGNDKEPESLKGLEAKLEAINQLPEQITKVREEQAALSLQIHNEKCAQTEVYRTLYEPVQGFIDSHILAKDYNGPRNSDSKKDKLKI